MVMEVFLQEEGIFQAPIELAQPFPAPELRANKLTDTRIFLTTFWKFQLLEDAGYLRKPQIYADKRRCLLKPQKQPQSAKTADWGYHHRRAWAVSKSGNDN